jgi:hypothetical protein
MHKKLGTGISIPGYIKNAALFYFSYEAVPRQDRARDTYLDATGDGRRGMWKE